MVAKKGKRSTKKVKSLKAKTLSADKAKRVRGGASFGVRAQKVQKVAPTSRANTWTG